MTEENKITTWGTKLQISQADAINFLCEHDIHPEALRTSYASNMIQKYLTEKYGRTSDDASLSRFRTFKRWVLIAAGYVDNGVLVWRGDSE